MQQQVVANADELKKGINANGPARLASYGDGPYAPISTNDNEDGRARNRRVELVKQ